MIEFLPMANLMKACVAILVGLLSCAVTAHSQQTPTSDCPSIQSLRSPELFEYAHTIADSVTRSWNAPSDSASDKHWSALARVNIAKDGQVSAVTITVSSGDSFYDQAATDTIRRASPFTPLPVSANVECITIGLNFSHAPGTKVLVTTGGGVYRVGGGVSPPKAIVAPDPEYTKEARKAKYGGVCLLSLIVTPECNPRDIHIVRPLGMGLDEKAIEAVKRWKFEPSMLNGKPVAVAINIEVNFRIK